MRYTYTLTPLTRVSPGRGGQVQNSRTIHRHVPGTTVRGALGKAWWTSPTHRYTNPDAQASFDRLFGAALEVHDALPRLQGSCGTVALRALSIVSLKYPGTRSSGRLPGTVCHDLATGPLEACPECAAPWPAGTGWSKPLRACSACDAVFDTAKGGWDVPEAWVAASTRTALNADGIAQDESLFTRLSIARTVFYRGTLVVRETGTPAAALAWLREAFDLSVGGQLSTHGRVRWSVEEAPEPTIPTTRDVVLRLLSPAILVDAWGAPSLDLRAALVDIPGSGSVAHLWPRTTQVSGWHGVAGVPKPVEWAIEAGSTAILRDWSPEALRTVSAGLGLRRLEGYGAVALLASSDLLETNDTDSVCVREATKPSATPPSPEAPTRQASAATSVPPGLGDTDETVEASTAPEDSDEAPDPLGTFLAGLSPDIRQRSINGLLTATRRAAQFREARNPERVLDLLAKQASNLPWCQALGPDARAAVDQMIRSTNVTTFVTRLEKERRA